jgi:hypothetical protein
LYIKNYNIETLTPDGKQNPVASLITTILLEISQMERQTIRERMKSGHRQYVSKCRENNIRMGRPSDYKKGVEEYKEQYQREILTNDFKGTIESKVGTEVVADTIERFIRDNEASYTVDYNNGQKSGTDLYAMEALETKDKYGVFFGGNQPIVRVSIDQAGDRKLLVLKDSYAHCFLPFTFEIIGWLTVS